MKKLTSYNRAAGYLNRIFDLLNEEYFENELSYGDIPRRKSNGNLMTNAPVNGLDCVNKTYVDEIVGDIENLLGGI